MSLPIDAAALARVQQPLSRAWTLPPQAYTAPAVFAAEAERLFRRQWLCVARADELPEPGDYRCLDLVDQPIVLVRGRDGELRALSRICLHRAMPVAEGAGRVTRFVCPYHHWTYELDGALRSAPMMDGVEDFDARACRLPALRTEIWHGFVFVNGDPDAAPLAPALSGFDTLLRNYRLDDLVVVDTQQFDSPWNWKILVENFLEAYHHIATHRHTLEPVYPARRSFVEDNGGAPWALLRMPADPSAHGDGGLPVFADLTEQQRHELIAGCVFPTFLLAATASTVVWYHLEPAAHDRMTLRIKLLLRPEVAAVLDDAARAAVRDAVRAVHLEDIPVNEGPWRGLQAPLTRQGRLSLFEKAIWQLNQWWAAHIQSG
jgi:phenylpropionate dioxygenase-like ring-hydroxylating dioxygenase large terminal subunit